ncbi:MAG: methyltransferase [Bacteroidetes bacterium]|nr:methyltransferase [Bacteroidota bacterium]
MEDEQCAMKVGTDGVLLGAWSKIHDEENILDIGTGSGVIALMIAQKCKANIDAIDIDLKSIEQAVLNFSKAKWSKRLKAIHSTLQNYVKKTTKKYDLIISNPPFFHQSLNSPIQEKNLSKHTNTLSFDSLAYGISQLMKDDGRVHLILPTAEAKLFLHLSLINGLYCTRLTMVRPSPSKPVNRWLIELKKLQENRIEDEIILRDANHNFTDAYIALTKDYYLKLNN